MSHRPWHLGPRSSWRPNVTLYHKQRQVQTSLLKSSKKVSRTFSNPIHNALHIRCIVMSLIRTGIFFYQSHDDLYERHLLNTMEEAWTYLWARHPAETDPTKVSKSCTKNTHCSSRKLALVWHPRSNRVGPRMATPIPKLPNTKQSVITDTQFSFRRVRKWGFPSPLSATRGSKFVGVVAMTSEFELTMATSARFR